MLPNAGLIEDIVEGEKNSNVDRELVLFDLMLAPLAESPTSTTVAVVAGGATQTREVSDNTVAGVLMSPNSQLISRPATPSVVAKFSPLIVTVTPPPTAQALGDSDETTMLGVYVYTNSTGDQSTPLRVTATPTAPILLAAGAVHEMRSLLTSVATRSTLPNLQARLGEARKFVPTIVTEFPPSSMPAGGCNRCKTGRS
jgi:hypothetical protein